MVPIIPSGSIDKIFYKFERYEAKLIVIMNFYGSLCWNLSSRELVPLSSSGSTLSTFLSYSLLFRYASLRHPTSSVLWRNDGFALAACGGLSLPAFLFLFTSGDGCCP